MTKYWRPSLPATKSGRIEALLSGNRVVVIYFWAAWNGVEQLFAPKVAAVSREFDAHIEFRSADVDDPELAAFCRESGVINVPALGCFVSGRRVKTIIGARSEDELRVEFTALLP